MPVSRGPRPDLRTFIAVGIAGAGVALGLVLGVLLLTRGGSEIEVRLGDRDFRNLEVDRISAEIADRGPVLFGDVADGQLDIIVQHLGDDPESGWLAFEARRADQSRDCYFQWRRSEADFVNTCDPDDVVDARGTGLRQLEVAVVDGEVRIDVSPN